MINKYTTETLSKEYISKLKFDNSVISAIINENINNSKILIHILENIGQIPSSFDGDILLDLFKHENENVRFWAVKNIGKLKSLSYLESICNVINNDESTIVKREAVSSLGRLKSTDTISILFEVLDNEDPKIVCQAIRALLVFKGMANVEERLLELINHENEVVRTIIYKEYFAKNSSSESKLPHAKTYSFLENTIVNGDVRDVLKLIPEDSIHLTFTSPPYYNARDYSIYPSYEAYLKFLEEVFAETYRTTKEGRFLIVNTSPVIVPRISRAHSSKRYPIPFDLHHRLVEMGWEFVDDIVWMKPEYSVKNRVGGFQQHRKPLAYKPNTVTEYLMVYRKQTSRLIDWNIKQYGVETVDQSRVKDGFETTNVWQISPKSDKIHSAIFPEDLCKRVIEYYSFKGDLIFDPFAGSGTLGRAAKKLGRKFFLTEIESKYFEYMQSQHKNELPLETKQTSFLSLDEFKNSIVL